MYNITEYSKNQAKKLGIKIKPSLKKFKKIDVYDKNDKFITSIGDSRYSDYATSGDKEQRRRFKLRFDKSRKVVGSNAWFSDRLLW